MNIIKQKIDNTVFVQSESGNYQYMKNHVFHREDGPAKNFIYSGAVFEISFFIDGVRIK